jgi:ribosomal protein L37AE/L43A
MSEEVKCERCENADGNLLDLKNGYWRCWACGHQWKKPV